MNRNGGPFTDYLKYGISFKFLVIKAKRTKIQDNEKFLTEINKFFLEKSDISSPNSSGEFFLQFQSAPAMNS